MNRHKIEVWDAQWARAQILSGQQRPAGFLRERLQEGMELWEETRRADAHKESPDNASFHEDPEEDPGYQHDYTPQEIRRTTQCNQCREWMAVPTTVIRQHYVYSEGRRVVHYFCMDCVAKGMRGWHGKEET